MRPHSRVGEGKEGGRAREKLALEVGAKAIAEHRDAEAVGDFTQLEHVPLREELGLVDEDAVDIAFLQLLPDRGEEVDALVIAVRRR